MSREWPAKNTREPLCSLRIEITMRSLTLTMKMMMTVLMNLMMRTIMMMIIMMTMMIMMTTITYHSINLMRDIMIQVSSGDRMPNRMIMKKTTMKTKFKVIIMTMTVMKMQTLTHKMTMGLWNRLI